MSAVNVPENKSLGLRERQLPSQPTESIGHEGARRPLKPEDSFFRFMEIIS